MKELCEQCEKVADLMIEIDYAYYCMTCFADLEDSLIKCFRCETRTFREESWNDLCSNCADEMGRV